MSFSSEVKEELSRHLGKSRHCQIAELAALIAFDGKVQVSESGCDLPFVTYGDISPPRGESPL